MKKIFSVLLIAFIALIFVTVLVRCAGWNQARIEQKYGPPTKKEIVDDKIIYQYHHFGRKQACLDLTFDKSGKLIGKREYYGERCNSQQIDYWLAKAGGEPPTIDVTGKWHDAQGSGFSGWGEGYLHQKQNKVSGAIGGYDIKGVVSGKTFYLVLLSAGTVHYTARLELSKEVLIGDFFGDYSEQSIGRSMILEKTAEATK